MQVGPGGVQNAPPRSNVATHHRPGRPLNAATIHDVAKAADVSVATVSRTLNGSDTVAPPTRERVLRAVGLLDYVPHSAARSLSTRRTDTIGVLLPDLHGEFFSELI